MSSNETEAIVLANDNPMSSVNTSLVSTTFGDRAENGNGPNVSIITAAYNHARFLPHAIESALNHERDDVELIVVDDGSTDETAHAIEPYLSHVRYYRQENQQLAGALNRCIELARGKYIRFLDADDAICPESISSQFELLDRHPNIGLVYGQAYIIDREGSVYDIRRSPPGIGSTTVLPSRWAFRWLLRGCAICTSTVMVRKAVFEHVGLYARQSVPGEDWDMWLRIAARYDVGYISEPIAFYRVHQDSITAGYTVDTVKDSHRYILSKLFCASEFPYSDMRDEADACLDRTLALVAARTRQPRQFTHYMLEALRRRPGLILERETWGAPYEALKMLIPSALSRPMKSTKRAVAIRRRNLTTTRQAGRAQVR